MCPEPFSRVCVLCSGTSGARKRVKKRDGGREKETADVLVQTTCLIFTLCRSSTAVLYVVYKYKLFSLFCFGSVFTSVKGTLGCLLNDVNNS